MTWIFYNPAEQFRNRRSVAFNNLAEVIAVKHQATGYSPDAIVRSRGRNNLTKLALMRNRRLLDQVRALISETKQHE
jgi:hypothetical protein